MSSLASTMIFFNLFFLFFFTAMSCLIVLLEYCTVDVNLNGSVVKLQVKSVHFFILLYFIYVKLKVLVGHWLGILLNMMMDITACERSESGSCHWHPLVYIETFTFLVDTSRTVDHRRFHKLRFITQLPRRSTSNIPQCHPSFLLISSP